MVFLWSSGWRMSTEGGRRANTFRVQFLGLEVCQAMCSVDGGGGKCLLKQFWGAYA